MAEPLEVQGLNSYYGSAQALFGVSLQVAPGEAVVLLGRNGAGKSTTLKSIMGLVPRREGRLRFGERDIAVMPPYRIARLGLGYVPEERRIFAALTVEENLLVGQKEQARNGDGRNNPWSFERLFQLFPNLAELRGRLGGQISGGEQQMLTIARTLMGNPSLLLLDEPSEGLAPIIVQQLGAAIKELKDMGLSLLLSEQNLKFASAIGDRAYVLESGHVRFAGTVDQLLADEEGRRRWLSL